MIWNLGVQLCRVSVRYVTYLEVVRGGGGAGEEPREHHVQRHVARAPHVALAHLDVLDLCRCNTHYTHCTHQTINRTQYPMKGVYTISGVSFCAAAGLDAHQL